MNKPEFADRPTLLSNTFEPQRPDHQGEPPSKVRFEIQPEGDMVKLTVQHFGFPESSKVFPAIQEGWKKILSELKSLLEASAKTRRKSKQSINCRNAVNRMPACTNSPLNLPMSASSSSLGNSPVSDFFVALTRTITRIEVAPLVDLWFNPAFSS